jgi:hypothetical protein
MSVLFLDFGKGVLPRKNKAQRDIVAGVIGAKQMNRGEKKLLIIRLAFNK